MQKFSTAQLPYGSSKIAGTATLAAIVGLALLIASAAPAAAAPKWVLGTAEHSTVVNCTSIVTGEPYTETGARVVAEWEVDRSKLPRVGEVFYVRTLAGAVGMPCADQAASVEVVLPRGVRLAVSRRNPIRCGYFDESGRFSAVAAGQGCPQGPGPGLYGRSLNRSGSGGPLWELPFGPLLAIELPLRSSRRLKGLAAPLPNCARRKQLGQPCPPGEAGDTVQFGVRVIDGNENPWLSPYIPLIVQGKGERGRCGSLRGRRRAACIRRSCGKLSGAKRRACVRKVTRRR